MVNAQEWLDKKYPKEKRSKITKLDISNSTASNAISFVPSSHSLEGSLKLEDFTNLEEFDCSRNKLTNLDLSECGKLVIFKCSVNDLTDTVFLNDLPYPEKLTELDIGNCNFSSQTLDFLRGFVGLKDLQICSYHEARIKGDVYNRFCGSLEPLKNLQNLERIDITNTDIDSGLDYLPVSVSKIRYHNNNLGFHSIIGKGGKREDAKSYNIFKQLNKYYVNNGTSGWFDLASWREDNIHFIQAKKELEERMYFTKSNILPYESTNLFQQPDQLLQELSSKKKEISSLQEQINLLKKAQTGTIKLENQLTQKEKELNILKEKNAKLTKQLLSYLNVISQFKEKQKRLAELKNSYSEKVKDHKKELNELCEAQDAIVSSQEEKSIKFITKRKDELKECLNEALTNEEIDELCNLQTDLTELDNKIEIIIQEQGQLITSQDKHKELLKKQEFYHSKSFDLYSQVTAQLGSKQELTKEETIDKIEEKLNNAFEKSLEASDLLGIKKLFLSIRQETIKNLWKCYELKYSLEYGKHAKVEASASILESIGSMEILNTATVGISGAVGKLTTISNDLWKKMSTKECIERFQEILKEDSKTYYRLVSSINKHEKDKISSPIREVKLFDSNYKVYEVIDISSEELDLTFEQMKETIELLAKSLKGLMEELETEKITQIQIPPK